MSCHFSLEDPPYLWARSPWRRQKVWTSLGVCHAGDNALNSASFEIAPSLCQEAALLLSSCWLVQTRKYHSTLKQKRSWRHAPCTLQTSSSARRACSRFLVCLWYSRSPILRATASSQSASVFCELLSSFSNYQVLRGYQDLLPLSFVSSSLLYTPYWLFQIVSRQHSREMKNPSDQRVSLLLAVTSRNWYGIPPLTHHRE